MSQLQASHNQESKLPKEPSLRMSLFQREKAKRLKKIIKQAKIQLEENLQKEKAEAHAQGIKKLELQFKEMIKQNSPDFSSKRDVQLLQNLEKEYEQICAGEDTYYEKNHGLLTKLLALLVMLNLLPEHTPAEDTMNSTRLLHYLTTFSKEVEKSSTYLEQVGLPSFPEVVSHEFMEKSIEQIEKKIQELTAEIERLEQQKTPDQLASEFLALLKTHDMNTGMSVDEHIHAELIKKDIAAYTKRYEADQQYTQTTKQRLRELVTQGMRILIKQIHRESDDGAALTQLHREREALYEQSRENWSDDELLHKQEQAEALGKKLHHLLAEHTKEITHRNTRRARLYQGDEQTVLDDIDQDVITEWEQRETQVKQEETLLISIEQATKERQQALTDEQTKRTFDKLKNEYTQRVENLISQHDDLVDTFLVIEKQAIVDARQNLANHVHDLTFDVAAAAEQIQKKTEAYNKGKQRPDLRKRAHNELIGQYAPDTLEYRLITQDVFSLSDEQRTQLPEYLAQQHQQGISEAQMHLSPHLLPSLFPGPELDRIKAYRAGFKEKIHGRIDHPEGIDGIIARAESMLADGSFRLSVCGGLPTGEYRLGGKTYGIVDAGNILSKEDCRLERQAIKGNNISNRPSAIATKLQPVVDAGAIPMHHTGKSKDDNDFVDVCQALQTTMNVSENDALLVMMYLQGLYGDYRVGGDLGYVFLESHMRGFGRFGAMIDRIYSDASLLLSANRLLSPQYCGGPDVGGASLSEAIPAADLDRISTYRTDRSTEISGTEKPKDELKQIADEMIATGEFSLVHKAGITGGRFNLGGYTKCFGSSDHHWKDKSLDPNDMLFEYEYDNKVLSTGTRYLPKIKALKGNTIDERKEPVRSQMKHRQDQGIQYDHGGELEICINMIMNEKGVTRPDALAIYMYLTGQYGWYRTGQYQDGSRGFVSLNDNYRSFDTHDYGSSNASLLLSR